MEAFESFVALALEAEELVVSEALKFPVTRQTPSGLQTHGYEVDLVGARADRLVLASVSRSSDPAAWSLNTWPERQGILRSTSGMRY